jgi:hypothetical protein
MIGLIIYGYQIIAKIKTIQGKEKQINRDIRELVGSLQAINISLKS